MRFIKPLKAKKLVVLSKTTLLVTALLWLGTAQAEEEWFSRSQRILKALEGQQQPEWLSNNPYQDKAKQQALGIIDQSKPIALGGQANTLALAKTNKPLRIMFISFSLGESVLKDIFLQASGQEDVLLVLRGPKPNQKLPGLFTELKRLLKDIDPVPAIVIDPTRFKKYAVTSVPDIVVEAPGKEAKTTLRVKGVTSLDWIKAQLEQHRKGDLGRFGQIYDIAEMDLLQEMKTRLAAIDWRQKKQQALARFWQLREFEILPKATEDHERLVDLTVTAPSDLLEPNGKLIIPAGLTVNPLDKMAFGLCLLVFDATEKAQIDLVKQWSCQDKKARVTYLATQLPRQNGWEALKSLETLLNAPVYLLTPDVRQRFKLESVPALVEQSGNKVLVRERSVISPSAGAAS